MKNRMSRCVALMGTVCSLSGFAQVCNEIPLYRGGETGSMEQGMTFPEAPEWSTNWGDMGSLVPPYIRWSGMKNSSGNWTGTMVLSGLPAYVQGGNLKVDVRASQNVKVGFWLEGDFGKSPVHYQDLAANISKTVTVPLAGLIGSSRALVQKMGVGLFGVPANQYTNFFMDNVSLSCGVSGEAGGSLLSSGEIEFPYSEVSPASPRRESRFLHSSASATSAAYSDEDRQRIADSTRKMFVLNEAEHLQIVRYVESDSLTALQSRNGWFRSMYLIERNRLKDSVIANPKTLFYEAGAFAANAENDAMPILVGNVDYGYRVCADTSCGKMAILDGRALLAGLPSATTSGSVLKLYYDPYFITTNRGGIPKVEILDNGVWKEIPQKSEYKVMFNSAGVQNIKVRLSEGGLTINQTLVVEVK